MTPDELVEMVRGVVVVNPGDLIVFEVPNTVTREQAEEFSETLKKKLEPLNIGTIVVAGAVVGGVVRR